MRRGNLIRRRNGSRWRHRVAPRPLEELAAYLYSVRVGTEARDGEECCELEALGQSWLARTFHKYDYVVQIATAQVLSTKRP